MIYILGISVIVIIVIFSLKIIKKCMLVREEEENTKRITELVKNTHEELLKSAYEKSKLLLPKINEYKSTLSIISLSNDEIEIINLLFEDKTNIVKLKQIISIDGKDYLIENNVNFDFKYEWCDHEPLVIYFSRPRINNDNNTALIDWGYTPYTELSGGGATIKFSKIENKWQKTETVSSWIS